MQTDVGQVLLGGLMSCGSLWKFCCLFSVRNEGKSPAESKDETGGDGVCVCVLEGKGESWI